MLNGLGNRCAFVGNSSGPAAVSETAAKNQVARNRGTIPPARLANPRLLFASLVTIASTAGTRQCSK